MTKPIILVLTFCYISLTSVFAQSVGGTPIEEIDVMYIQLSKAPVFSNQTGVHIDFGQKQRPFSFIDTQLMDKNGKPMKFNSMMDALNFMDRYGYELVEVYIENEACEYFLMKKKTPKP